MLQAANGLRRAVFEDARAGRHQIITMDELALPVCDDHIQNHNASSQAKVVGVSALTWAEDEPREARKTAASYAGWKFRI